VTPCEECQKTNRELGLPFNEFERVELVEMLDDPAPIPPGTKGTVRKVRKFLHRGSAWFQIDVDWDNQRTLACVVPPDKLVSLQRPRERAAALKKWKGDGRGNSSN